MNINKSYKSTVSVPLEIALIEEIDRLSSQEQISRAGYIRDAVKEKVLRDKKSNT